MKDLKLSISVSVDGAQSDVNLALVPAGENLFKPIIDLSLSNGLKTRTELPPSDYKRLRERLERVVKSADLASVELLIRRMIILLGV